MTRRPPRSPRTDTLRPDTTLFRSAEATAKGRQVALFLLDLDHFKTVNDIHSHVAGDRVLQIAAERIAAVLPPSATKARLGGDEFVDMLAFEPAARADIDVLAGQLIAALANPVASRPQPTPTRRPRATAQPRKPLLG